MNYLKLVRWPNLLIIILSQVLLRYCVFGIYLPVHQYGFGLSGLSFTLLVVASTFIAAAGNIINDITDRETDMLNKPGSNKIGNPIPVNNVWLLYYILNGAGLASGVWVAVNVGYYWLGVIFPIIILALYDYSIRLKCKPLTGNLLVSLLSSMTIGIVWLFELFSLMNKPVSFASSMKGISSIHLLVLFYMVFAFLISLLREITKDVADVKGDKAGNCFTIPVVYGEPFTRRLLMVITAICLALLVTAEVFLFYYDYSMVLWYLIIAVDTLLLYFLYDLLKGGNNRENYVFRGNMLKLIMVAGILSMQILFISR